MRFECVTTHAFGPFAHSTLSLAPGMTVIYGPNESGKSSWHAALYAGLCGVRRSRGGTRAEDREFAERHRPWDGNAWEIVAVLRLDDGRRIELRHDLDGKVDCRAHDADLGRDVSAEIMHEGAPDGSRWLGLDRRSFLAIACVGQADVLGVLDDPVLLQEHLQRAADTAGTDATAAAAIVRLDDYARTFVGPDRLHSVKPLRAAREWVEAAQQAAERARGQHADYLQLMARSDELSAAAAAAGKRVRLIEAARAGREAEAIRRRLERARALTVRCPQGPPPTAASDEALAQDAAEALEAWSHQPEVTALEGKSAEALRADVDALPPVPVGDLTPARAVIEAHDAYERSAQALELHAEQRPVDLVAPPVGGLSADALRALAIDLEARVPPIDPELQRAVDDARAALDKHPKRPQRTVAVVVGLALAASGVAAVAFGPLPLGLALLLFGVAALLWAGTRGNEAHLEALEALHAAEDGLGAQRYAADAAAARRQLATERAAARGVPTDATALRELAGAVAAALRAREDVDRWNIRQRELARGHALSEQQLSGVLAACGVAIEASLRAAVDAYGAACARRAQVAAEAARRPDLQAQLAAREAAEHAAHAALARRDQATQRLRQVAAVCGIAGADDEQRARGLRRWQQQRAARSDEQAAVRAAWVELAALLEGGTLEELAAQAAQHAERAASLQADLSDQELRSVTGEAGNPALLESARREAQRMQQAAAEAKGQAEERAQQLSNVPQAEEELAAASAEVARVRQLGATLDLTREFLERAQERVHRDIARVLADTIRPWLPAVTAGRYTDVRVDPQSLAVSVCSADGAWRDAALLSHGTAEQVYLLLRVALAQHLTSAGETCPLILDDITVQCDSRRKPAVLALLHTLSRQRQVILFSQEDEVLAWAQANLTLPADRLERLPPRDSVV